MVGRRITNQHRMVKTEKHEKSWVMVSCSMVGYLTGYAVENS